MKKIKSLKTNKKIGVSIIVPCYKRIKQTIKTINLIFNSDGWSDIYQCEVIVADSTRDNSLKKLLLKTFSEKQKKKEFFYIKPKKIGISVNKNAGAKKAKFPIIIFCDSDMEVAKNTILNTINILKNNKKAAAVMGNVIWKGGKSDGKFDRPRKEDRMIKAGNISFVEAIYSRYMATYKEVFENTGGYDEKVFNMRGEGSDLSIRYWRNGYPLAYSSLLSVRHIANTPDSIALGIKNPEWGIAKDLLLLSYKYEIFGENHKNFARTVKANFDKFGEFGYYKIIEGIVKYLDFIAESKRKIDVQKKNAKPKYDFKFLEIFSNKNLYHKCMKESEKELNKIRKKIFK